MFDWFGEKQSNPNARNYFLSQALEAKGQTMYLEGGRTIGMIHSIPLSAIFGSLAVNLVPEKSFDFDKMAVFNFTDTNEKWTIQIRKGVAEIQSFAMEIPDLTITTTSNIWKEIVAKIRKPAVAIAKGDLSIEGGMSNFSEFMDMFKED